MYYEAGGAGGAKRIGRKGKGSEEDKIARKKKKKVKNWQSKEKWLMGRFRERR